MGPAVGLQMELAPGAVEAPSGLQPLVPHSEVPVGRSLRVAEACSYSSFMSVRPRGWGKEGACLVRCNERIQMH